MMVVLCCSNQEPSSCGYLATDPLFGKQTSPLSSEWPDTYVATAGGSGKAALTIVVFPTRCGELSESLSQLCADFDHHFFYIIL